MPTDFNKLAVIAGLGTLLPNAITQDRAQSASGVIPVPGVVSPRTVLPQGGRVLNLPIPAGATVRGNAAGTQLYLIVATSPVNIRPLGGDFVTYSQGTGVRTTEIFQYAEIQNFNDFPVVISLWIGYDSFIDNRLILASSAQSNVAYPTYPVANSAASVNIVDLSGGAFTDINGVGWLALSRAAILIFNLDTGNTYLLYQFSPTGAAGTNAIASIPPAPLPLRLDMGGNFTINIGGGPVNMIVSEIYNAIPAVT